MCPVLRAWYTLCTMRSLFSIYSRPVFSIKKTNFGFMTVLKIVCSIKIGKIEYSYAFFSFFFRSSFLFHFILNANEWQDENRKIHECEFRTKRYHFNGTLFIFILYFFSLSLFPFLIFVTRFWGQRFYFQPNQKQSLSLSISGCIGACVRF